MTVTPAEETITTPNDTGDKLSHAYCRNGHEKHPNGRALCGAKRNHPWQPGLVTVTEGRQKGYCNVCIDLAEQMLGQCLNCTKGTP